MDAFEARIRAEKQRDSELLRAVPDTLGYARHKKAKKGVFQRHAFHGSTAAYTGNVIKELLKSLGMEPVDVPPGKGLLEEQLDYVLNNSGLMKRRISLKGHWWRETREPLLGQLAQERLPILIRPERGNRLCFINPLTGQTERLNSKNACLIAEEALCFYKPFPCKKMGLADLLNFIYDRVKGGELLSALLSSAAAMLLGLVFPFMSRVLFDRVIPSGTTQDILPIAGILTGSAFGAALLGLAESRHLNVLGGKVRTAVENAAWGRLMHLPAGFFREHSSGTLMESVQAFGLLSEILTGSGASALLSLLLSMAYLYQISFFANKLVFPAFLIVFLLTGFSLAAGFLEADHLKKTASANARLSGFVSRLLSGMGKIKTGGARIRAFARWAGHYGKKAALTSEPHPVVKLSEAVLSVSGLGAALFLYSSVMVEGVGPADFMAFNAAFAALLAADLRFCRSVGRLSALKASLELAGPILRTLPEAGWERERVGGLGGKIDLAHIRFRYHPEGPLVLNDLSLSVKPGEYVGVVGPSGCGKSTLFRMLLGFEAPQAGAVLYDDKNIEKLDLASIRRHMGVVLQNSSLFADSLYANIALCSPFMTLEEAWEAAEMAGLADDIRKMPMGMHTMLSEGGGGLSGGQRQRVAIARAFASKPDILLFDEATSALDNKTQSGVTEILDKMAITRIVIAHRLSTVKKCHRIIVLDKGRVAEAGSYESLMAQNGLFARMAERQTV